MIIGISGKINSGKDLIGEIILYLTDKYYHSKVGKEASFENWKTSNIHSSGYNISHKAMYEVNNTSHFKIKKFANKLKDIVCLLIGCTREQLEDESFKSKELGEEWWKFKVTVSSYKVNSTTIYYRDYLDYKDSYGENAEKYPTIPGTQKAEIVKMTPRLLLQLLGTDCGRQIIHPNIWVNGLMSDYKEYNYAESISGTSEVKKLYKYPNWIITDMRFPNELEAVKKRGGITIRVNRDYVLSGGPENPKDQHESETALDNAEFDYVIDNNKDILYLISEVRKILEKKILFKKK